MLPGPLPGTTKCAFLRRPRPLLDLLSQAEPGYCSPGPTNYCLGTLSKPTFLSRPPAPISSVKWAQGQKRLWGPLTWLPGLVAPQLWAGLV